MLFRSARQRRTSSSAACPSRSSTDFWTRVTAFTTAVGSQVSSVSSPPLPPRPAMSTSWYTRSADSPRARARKAGLNGLERRDQPAAADLRWRRSDVSDDRDGHRGARLVGSVRPGTERRGTTFPRGLPELTTSRHFSAPLRLTFRRVGMVVLRQSSQATPVVSPCRTRSRSTKR